MGDSMLSTDVVAHGVVPRLHTNVRHVRGAAAVDDHSHIALVRRSSAGRCAGAVLSLSGPAPGGEKCVAVPALEHTMDLIGDLHDVLQLILQSADLLFAVPLELLDEVLRRCHV